MHKNLLLKYYFIKKFDKSILDIQDKNTTIIYRNYKERYNVKKILNLKDYCKRRGLKFILSNNIKLAIKLKLDGAYIPSFNRSLNHLSYKLKNSFVLLGSAHNLRQIRFKEKQRVNKIFISSIFKRNNNYLGINKFKKLSILSNRKIVALGGISENNLRYLSLARVFEFAGISYFQNKKKGP